MIHRKKKIEDTGCMFQKRLNSALGMKSSIKVRKQKVINAFKRELSVGSRYCSGISFLLDLHHDIDRLYDIFFQHHEDVVAIM